MAGLDPAIHVFFVPIPETRMPGHQGVHARLRRAMAAHDENRDYLSSHSAHFGTSPLVPHGMIGTVEVEFFGEPSISRSEYTM